MSSLLANRSLLPPVLSTSSRPAARATDKAASMVSLYAWCDSGRTIPLVPRMERPPSTPSRGLSVFLARVSPSVTKTSTSTRLSLPVSQASSTSSTAHWIICLGTGLMAGSPTFTGSPGLVTSPTPSPALYTISVLAFVGPRIRTRAPISAPWVTSGSSPASLTTEHSEVFPSNRLRRRGTLRTLPSGRVTEIGFSGIPVNRS